MPHAKVWATGHDVSTVLQQLRSDGIVPHGLQKVCMVCKRCEVH